MKQKKHIGEAIVAVIITLALVLPGSTMAANNETTEKGEEELDQHQEVAVEGIFLPVGRLIIPDIVDLNFQIAQSFIPQKAILTRIEIFIAKNVTTSYPFALGIRDELTKPDMATTNVAAEAISTENFTWVEFDIPDLWITVGQTYYIVCYTENITDNFYGWAANNDSDSYPNGCAWISTDDGDTWTNDSVSLELKNNQHTNPKGDDTWDMVFRTYGIDSTNLVIDYQPGLLQPKFLIKNVGSITAYDVEVSAQVTGGILNRINKSFSTNTAELVPDESLTLMVGPVFGFGPITITVIARALNAQEVSTEKSGFVIIAFMIIATK
jgi:hypothetical protein